MKDEQRGAGVADGPPASNEAAPPAAVRAQRPAADNGGAPEGGGEKVKAAAPARGIWREYFESLVVTAVMALFGMTFIVQAVKVPTGSMQNTIIIGDHLLVNKFIFAPGPPAFFLPQREIRRGDIVVFKYPGKFPSEPFISNPDVDDTREDNIPFKTNYVKRVVGLPGERVEIRGTHVLINGQPLEEHRVAANNLPDDPDTEAREDNAPLRELADPAPTGEGDYNVFWRPDKLRASEPLKDGDRPRPARRGVESKVFDVPDGHYFVMGDNRDNSLDSRFWGYVRRDLIIGRAMFVYWSYDESAPSSGFFLLDFIKNSRWTRTGTLVR